MTDQVKESVFNMLGARLAVPGQVPPVAVLDLFAGSGALGLEALSRGAESVLFVERDRRALRTLQGNIQRLRAEELCRVASENIWTWRLPRVPGGFGLAFCDPPFKDVQDTLRITTLLERLATRLSDEGLIVFRHDQVTRFLPENARGVVTVADRTLGRNRLLFLAAMRAAAPDEQKQEEQSPEQIGDDADG
jgi:16S rRNA (guanine966-N2)-methyltransferase